MVSTPSIPGAIPSALPSSLRRSNSLPNLSAQSNTGLTNSESRIDSVSLQNKATQTDQATEKTARDGKRFYQPILDFFINAYQKFMDFFTPTSKEAIEKSLAKATSKQRKYLDRIFLQQALQSPEKGSPELQSSLDALTPTEQAFIVQDGQKAAKKLEALTPKIEKLSAKYTRLTGVNISEATPQNSEAPNAKPQSKVSQLSPVTTPEAAVAEGIENTGESLVKDLKSALKDIFDPNGETAQELKKACPALADIFENILKFVK